ncbi:MAG: hemolysin III family protein [Clostridiales bacterium]|nr:hemolysin III family protein [Clostridiales bacterium]
MNKKYDSRLPDYTKGEEIFNAVTHIVGGAFGILFLVIGVILAHIYGNASKIASMYIYGISMIIAYTMSSIYHFLRPNRAKKVFRIFDHCSIFLLIAGSYTPYCLVTLSPEPAWGYTLFSIVWGLSILGIVLNGVNMYRWQALSMTLYIALGWCILLAIVPLLRNLAFNGFLWLLAGGIAYTIGAIFFAFGHKVKYIHSVWHLFVLLGSVLQFVSILFYVVL